MKRLIPLLSLIAIACSMTASNADTAPGAASLASLWSASTQAETGKNYDEALKQVTAYQQQGGDKFLATMRTGWLYYLKQDYAKALAFYTAANQMQPAALNPLLGLLNVAQAQNDPLKIQAASDAVLHIEPSNYRAQMALAGAAYGKKDYRKARSSYRRVLTYYPEDIDATGGEAWTSYFLADPRQAFRGFAKILSLNADYPYAQKGYDLTGGKPTKSTLQNGKPQPSADLPPASGL